MGEHAVVYGHPALVAAVNLRLRARFGSPRATAGEGPGGRRAPPAVELLLPRVGHRERIRWPGVVAYAAAARERWERYASAPDSAAFARLRGRDPAHLVKVALGEASRHLGEGEGPPLLLEVDSELPLGSGFGSSAALAVAVAGGYLAWRGRAVPCDELERLALEVERRQHGLPSGVDAATVLRGGILWARRAPGGGLRLRSLDLPALHLERFRAFDTGSPAEPTGAVVAAVRERVDAEPRRLGRVLERLGELTAGFRDALAGGSAEEVVELIRRYEEGLETLGVVPRRVREVIRRVEAEGGAAKISGAGALTSPRAGPPGGGSLLVYHPRPESAAGWDFLADFPRHALSLGAPGFRREEGGDARSPSAPGLPAGSGEAP